MRFSLISSGVVVLVAGCAYAAPASLGSQDLRGLQRRGGENVQISSEEVDINGNEVAAEANEVDISNGQETEVSEEEEEIFNSESTVKETQVQEEQISNQAVTIKDQQADITVTDLQVDAKSNGQEVLFEKKVTQILVKNKNTIIERNEVREQLVSSQNPGQNVIIQVVQTIIDVSRGNAVRYAMSNILADNGSPSTVTCQMTDAQTLTVGAGDCGANAAATDAVASAAVASDATASASAGAAAPTGVANAAAPFNMANQTMLLPANATAPQAGANVMLMDDPATDLLDSIQSIC